MTTVATQPKPKRVARKPKVQDEVAKEPVPEPPVVEEPVVEDSEESSDEGHTFDDQLHAVKNLVKVLTQELKNKLKDLKDIEHELNRLNTLYKKDLKSKNKRTKKPNPNNNHGFQAPVGISDELADFLGVERGVKMRRPEVTKMVNAYAKKNNLKDGNNGAIFLPDAKLKKIFGPPVLPIKKAKEGENEYPKGYSIFNFQTYMKRHFIK
jgi:chromatin remodeling complex protein RSC6